MCGRFNQAAAIDGKMPLGLFNNMFSFTGPWQTDQHATKTLALDGWFVKLYNLQLTRTPLTLRDEIRKAIPSSWEPKALARWVHNSTSPLLSSDCCGHWKLHDYSLVRSWLGVLLYLLLNFPNFKIIFCIFFHVLEKYVKGRIL